MSDNMDILRFANVLRDTDQKVRHDAFLLLNQKPNPYFTQLLIKALEDEYTPITFIAAQTLVQIGPSAEQYLISMLNTGSNTVKCLVCQILANIGSSKAVLPLLDLLGNEDVEVRHHAVNALAYIKDRRAIDRLEFIAEHDHEEIPWWDIRISEAAKTAIQRIQNSSEEENL